MEEVNIESTLVESAPPVSEPAQESVYGGTPGGYQDATRALQGDLQSQIKEAAETAPPPGQRFGMSEERKAAVAATLKAQRESQPVATAAAPALAKAAPPVDAIKRATEFVGNYFDDDGDVSDLLGRLYDADYDRYEKLISHVVSSNRDYALRLLGHNVGPSGTDPAFMHLPEHLREVAANMQPDIWNELQFARPGEQVFHLEREAKLQEQERAEWEQAERDHEETLTRVERESVQMLQKWSDAQWSQHQDTLKDFTPFDDEKDNKAIHSLLMTFALNEMLEDKQFAQDRNDLAQVLLEIPYYEALGQKAEADINRKIAARLRNSLDRRYSAHLKSYRDLLEGEFRDAKLWRESQGKGAQPEFGAFEQGDQIPGTRFHYRRQ